MNSVEQIKQVLKDEIQSSDRRSRISESKRNSGIYY